jgi:two-component system nitrogen regulation response regulator GlnG
MNPAQAGKTRVLVADDEQPMRFVLKKALESHGFEVDLAEDGNEALARLKSEPYPIAFIDIKMPGTSGLDILDRLADLGSDTSVIIITAQSTMENAVEAMRRGAYEYLTKPFNLDEAVHLARKALDSRAMVEEAREREEAPEEAVPPERTLIGESQAMQKIFKTIGRLSRSDVTVLIQGESGTGKELIARALHRTSRRHGHPFVAVNTSAIPGTLMESELFGFERGAFTGAHQRHLGKFEQADGGTLFLDEIGEMSLDLQAKLLRVLQEGEFQRVGATRNKKVNVRIIAATNQDLDQAVQRKRFRPDLYYRLNVVAIEVPPLRERREDIPLLAQHFLRKFHRELGLGEKFLSEDAMRLLKKWSWPGNVRELENLIKRAMALATHDALLPADITVLLSPAERAAAETDQTLDELTRARIARFLEHLDPNERGNLHQMILSRVEKPLIEMVLAKVGGNQVRAAGMLGINRNTLRKKILDLKIEIKK